MGIERWKMRIGDPFYLLYSCRRDIYHVAMVALRVYPKFCHMLSSQPYFHVSINTKRCISVLFLTVQVPNKHALPWRKHEGETPFFSGVSNSPILCWPNVMQGKPSLTVYASCQDCNDAICCCKLDGCHTCRPRGPREGGGPRDTLSQLHREEEEEVGRRWPKVKTLHSVWGLSVNTLCVCVCFTN